MFQDLLAAVARLHLTNHGLRRSAKRMDRHAPLTGSPFYIARRPGRPNSVAPPATPSPECLLGQPYWTFGQELDLVSDYIAVQRMRFQERLHLEEWRVDSVARSTRFPRLVLQPLVENVFKHGVAQSPRATSVGLSVWRSRKTLRLTIWNDAALTAAANPSGRGLAFVVRRVRAAGGGVTIESPKGGRYRVRCSIPVTG